MKTYELTYITVAEEGHDAASINEALAANGTKIISVHPWGARRRLAYPIKKQDQAFYTTVVFDAEPSAVKPIDSALALNNNVLRHLIVEFEPGMFQRVAETSNRDGRDSKESKESAVKSEEETSDTTPIEEVAAEEIVAPVSEAEVETPAAEEVASETTETSAPADSKELDEKIDALLNEEIV